eukprot:scaffold862_cov34-Prasinocladus_malaysianus.AAC.1
MPGQASAGMRVPVVPYVQHVRPRRSPKYRYGISEQPATTVTEAHEHGYGSEWLRVMLLASYEYSYEYDYTARPAGLPYKYSYAGDHLPAPTGYIKAAVAAEAATNLDCNI